MVHKIVVFTSRPNHSVCKGIDAIDRRVRGLSWLIVVHAPRMSVRTLARNQWRNLSRHGWRWLPYQAADVVERLRRHRRPSDSIMPGGTPDIAALGRKPNVRVAYVENINGPESRRAVAMFGADLGLSLAAPILGRELFALPRLGTLNLHKGKLPDYRGMPPAFWELWNDEQSVGCSVHWVDDKLDTGAIVAECAVAREPFSTVRGMQLRLDEVGVELMRRAVESVGEGRAAAVPQAAGGRTNRKPLLSQVAALERKLAVPRSASRGKQWLKNAAGRAAFGLWRAGIGALMAPRITVLLYHRVTDAARDNLSVGIEQFDRQMGLLRRYCEPLSIEQVLASATIPRSRRPLVCVTFDDGYLDNYTHAVPILLRHRIPAAFFVSTGIVGSDGRFPHDVRRGNPPIQVMQWSQLREMHESGFTIGSHSVSHIDCARESELTVWDELVRSMQDLRRELALTEVLFAYPYGGRQHMTPDRLELVKKAGYSGCLSAYGGANLRAIDRFNVLRRGIQWEFSDDAFLLECLGVK